MNLQTRGFTIGALAKAAGVSTPTIRYYEEIGLLPRAPRTNGGQRSFDRADLNRLTFVKQCREFGFGIEQVRVLLDLSISADRDCLEARDIAKAHLDAVREKLSELRALEQGLESFVTRCNTGCAGGAARNCSIFTDMVARPD
jgi:MerR family copper efflux transcriptional regulator